MNTWNYALSGMILLGYWAIGLFFFRFWRKNADRFFLFFSFAFWLLACERVFLLAANSYDEIKPYDEVKPFIYLVRLIAFLFILFAIFDKNRTGSSKPRDRQG